MQDVPKTKNLLLDRVAGGHQKATESEIRTHIGNTLKIEGGLFKEEKPCGSKCSRNGTLSHVNLVKDMYYNP